MPAGGQFEGKDIIVFSKISGMATQFDREDMPEDKASWLENLQPVAANKLLSVPAAASSLARLFSETITEKFFAPLGGVNYDICFTESGAAYAVNLATGAKTQFAAAGTFSQTPDCTLWGNQRILIADPTAGYCTWDTHTLALFGGVSPNIQVTAGGANYTSPVVAITGGTGVGATATATASGGVITAITLTSPGTGYLAGDTLTVTLTDGGAGAGATATAHPWPNLSPKPTTLAVFSGRVWLASGNVLTWTGTGAAYAGVGYDDFKSADASGSTTIQDPDLITTVTALRSLNNYLFIIGDASVKQIGNISVSGSATNFTTVTLSSDQGTTFRSTIISYNRLVLFANTVGVFAVFGSSVEKISDDMDGIFRKIDFTQAPCAAVNDINNIHCYLLLVKINDPVQGNRSIILTFMSKKWFVVSQGGAETYIMTAVINGVFEAFATSGSDVTQILADATQAVSIQIITSLSSHGAPYQSKQSMRYAVSQRGAGSSNLQLTVQSENPALDNSINYSLSTQLNFQNDALDDLQFQNQGGQDIDFVTNTNSFFYATGNPGSTVGCYLGATLSGEVVNYSLNCIMIEFGTGPAFGSSAPNPAVAQ